VEGGGEELFTVHFVHSFREFPELFVPSSRALYFPSFLAQRAACLSTARPFLCPLSSDDRCSGCSQLQLQLLFKFELLYHLKRT
jgi:hypothetical protein